MGRWIAMVLIAFSVGACGEEHNHDDHHHDTEGHDAEAVAYEDGLMAMTDDGQFHVALTLSGGGTVGVHDVTLELSHMDEPSTGLSVGLVAYMPAHGHGTNDVTVVETDEAGTYLAEGLDITMAGDWELTVSVDDTDAVYLITIP